MKIFELQKELIRIGVPENIYSILNGGLPNEVYCIVKNNDIFEVYYSERGHKSGLRLFSDEDSACNYFYGKVKNYADVQE